MPESTPWEYTLYIPNDPRAVTISRRTLRLILTMHGLIRLVDTAELLAAELIANAVRHTKGPAALRVRWSPGVLRIGAWDADPEPPEPPQEFELLGEAEQGRGLALCVPVPTCGGGSRWRKTATGASTCGSNWPRPSQVKVRHEIACGVDTRLRRHGRHRATPRRQHSLGKVRAGGAAVSHARVYRLISIRPLS
jgi:anti-sigma regulatory factor (Ser/Thr protein kinase)